MALLGSTKVIFNTLLQSPLTRGHAITFSNNEDSEGGHSVNRPISINSGKDEGRSEDASLYELKIKNPTFMPKPKHILTPEEQKQLDKEYNLAKSLLNNFIEMLRLQGLDPATCSVFINTNNRVIYRIPPEHSKNFRDFIINKITLAKQLKETPEAETSKRYALRM